jgi:hypothetical protein
MLFCGAVEPVGCGGFFLKVLDQGVNSVCLVSPPYSGSTDGVLHKCPWFVNVHFRRCEHVEVPGTDDPWS